MAGIMGVTYTTVSTICPSALFGGLVDLDMGDDKGRGVEAFGIGIGFGVAEESKEKLGRLLGPASTGDAKLFTYSNLLVTLFCPEVT